MIKEWLICNECEEVFDVEETTDVHKGIFYENNIGVKEVYGCPHCHSADIEDACQCVKCKEWFEYKDMRKDIYNGVFCKECYLEEYEEE